MTKEMIVEVKITVNQKKSNLSLKMIEKCQSLTMFRKNITETNTLNKIINTEDRKKLMIEQKTMIEVMKEEIIKQITEEMKKEKIGEMTLMQKDQEVSLNFNLNKKEIKGNKEEDITKIIVSNLKGKITTLKRIFTLSQKTLKIMYMLEEKLTSINFTTKSKINYLNTILLELKLSVVKLLELSS